MMSQIKKHWEIILVGLLVLPFVYFAWLYFKNDSLAVYDAPGHLGIAWYLKNYLWPNFTGWNFLSLLGFDQGRFYPPLFHYLVAGLNFFFNLDLAAKLVIILALLALPVSIYYFAASIFKDSREKVLLTGLLVLLLVLLPGYLGAGVKALFQVGLLPSFFSTPLLFAYFGSLLRFKKIGLFWPTLFLVLILLTHLVALFVAIIFLISVLVIEISQRKSIKNYLSHIVLSAAVTAFWWLPFLFQTGQVSASAHLSSLGLPNIACLLFSLGIMLYGNKKKSNTLRIIAVSVLFFSTLTCFDYFVEKLLPNTLIFNSIYKLHLYRFQIYEFILTLVLVSYYPITWLYSSLGKVKSRLYFIGFTPILAAFLVFFLRPPVLVTTNKTEILNADKINGRFLETFSRSKVYPYLYSSQTDLQLSRQLPWAYGLFTDASQNGPFLSSLIRSFSPDDYQKAKTNLIEEKTIDPARFKKVLDLFGISSLINNNFFKEPRSNGLDLFVFDRGEQSLVEIPKLKLVSIKDNWDQSVADWWVKKGELTDLLVKVSKGAGTLPQAITSSGEVKLTSHNKNFSNFTLETNEKTAEPILVKFSYSPNWKAYQSSKTIKIYQASPNLMLVVAKGQVTFKYETLWYQYFAYIISFLTLGYLIITALFKLNKND